MELGAGYGFCGVVAGRLASSVTWTDCRPEVLQSTLPEVIEKNKSLLSSWTTLITELDWASNLPDITQYDLVIGAELMYKSVQFLDLFRIASKSLKPNGKLVLAFVDECQGPTISKIVQTCGLKEIESHKEEINPADLSERGVLDYGETVIISTYQLAWR